MAGDTLFDAKNFLSHGVHMNRHGRCWSKFETWVLYNNNSSNRFLYYWWVVHDTGRACRHVTQLTDHSPSPGTRQQPWF